MSRVFLAAETFRREIQLAAVQHPHLVPVLTAGDSAGLPYYHAARRRRVATARIVRDGVALPKRKVSPPLDELTGCSRRCC